jgi:hypothetical protein
MYSREDDDVNGRNTTKNISSIVKTDVVFVFFLSVTQVCWNEDSKRDDWTGGLKKKSGSKILKLCFW